MLGKKQEAQPQPVEMLQCSVEEYEKAYKELLAALDVASNSGGRWHVAKAREQAIRFNCAVRGIDYRSVRRGK